MKTTLVKQLCKKYLLPDLPGYEVKGHLLYDRNYIYLLPGIYFESSSFNKERFTIDIFVQPLYIPATGLWWTFGNRLGMLAKGRDVWWEYREENERTIMQEIGADIHRVGIPFLETRKTLKDFIAQYRNKVDFAGDTYVIETVAYGCILLGEYQKAEKILGRFMIELDREIKRKPEISWLIDVQKRAKTILQHLQEKAPDAARQQLDEWTTYTLSEIKLKRE